jgi:hypothetical protein
VIPRRIEGATRVLGAPRNWDAKSDGECGGLAILDIRDEGASPRMVSAWEPTPAELAALLAGAPVYLQIVGAGHPPVWVWVDEAKAPVAQRLALAHLSPVPMLLFCPKCGLQHVDAPDEAKGWHNPPHRSHLCAGCGTIWRPADVPTTGVDQIGTRGSSDTFAFEDGIGVELAPSESDQP